MTNLRCTYCGTEYDADTLQTLCPKDGRVLAPQYDLARAAQTMTKESLKDAPDDDVAIYRDHARAAIPSMSSPSVRAGRRS